MSSLEAGVQQDRIGHLGLAMLAAGSPVTDVHLALDRLSARDDLDLTIGTLPNSIIVDSPATERARLYSQPHGTSLRWDQSSAVGAVVARAIAGAPSGVWWTELNDALDRPSRYGPVVACIGTGLLSAGMATVFGTGLPAMLVAGVCGLLVGAMVLWSARYPRFTAIVPLLSSFVVSTLVFTLESQLHFESSLYAVVAPLVILIPGAMITNGVVELAAGDMMSGSGRISAGLLIWASMAFGVISGATVARVDLTALPSIPTNQLPQWAPWVALIAIAVGLGLFFSCGLALTACIAVVLELTHGIQRLAEIPTNSVVAGGITAAVMLLATRLVELWQPHLPSIITFRPAFWLLVPGSFGLVAVTSVGVAEAGSGSLIELLIGTVIAISVGVQIGAMLAELIHSGPPRKVVAGISELDEDRIFNT